MIEKIRLNLSQGSEITYNLYIPEKNIDVKKVVVSIHGLSRNHDSHFNLNLPYAKEKNYILIVPEFERDVFEGYNALGVEENEIRSDIALNEILDDVSKRINSKIEKINLMGYSAGAQFAHRYAMIYPEKIEKLYVCAPGFYTFIDQNVEYPLGLKTSNYPQITNKWKIDEFLRLPIYLYVGEKDISREGNFRKDDFTDSFQGRTRVERARNWHENIQEARKEAGVNLEFEFYEISNSHHSYETCMENGLDNNLWKNL